MQIKLLVVVEEARVELVAYAQCRFGDVFCSVFCSLQLQLRFNWPTFESIIFPILFIKFEFFRAWNHVLLFSFSHGCNTWNNVLLRITKSVKIR